ncbi:MAG: hypothetical protein RMJ15_09465 [Nitrososphaerota archaeon]|nr:hypothetical protein [Candidatus Bathyarchaeota archaeon]MDW8023944.1 hypothetical protein [Nitrososphaerota archaeon]
MAQEQPITAPTIPLTPKSIALLASFLGLLLLWISVLILTLAGRDFYKGGVALAETGLVFIVAGMLLHMIKIEDNGIARGLMAVALIALLIFMVAIAAGVSPISWSL